MKWIGCGILLIFFLPLLSCTTVKIFQADGGVSVARHFGFVKILPVDDTSVVTAEVTSFGYTSTPIGYSFGLSKQSVTTADESCHFILWIDQNSNQQEVIEVLRTLDGSCVIKH